MKIFIEGTNNVIWKDVKEGPFSPTRDVNGVVVDKPEKIGLKIKKRMCNMV